MKKWIIGSIGTIGAIITATGIYLHSTMHGSQQASITIIGGADGPTSIFLSGKLGPDLSVSLLVVGVILLAVAIFLLIKNKKRT